MNKIVEEKIRKAMEKGEFDNLPGRGKPIDLSEYFKAPAHLRAGYSLLKNANVIPSEMVLKKEIEELKELRGKTRSKRKNARLTKAINEKTAGLNLLLERQRD